MNMESKLFQPAEWRASQQTSRNPQVSSSYSQINAFNRVGDSIEGLGSSGLPLSDQNGAGTNIQTAKKISTSAQTPSLDTYGGLPGLMGVTSNQTNSTMSMGATAQSVASNIPNILDQNAKLSGAAAAAAGAANFPNAFTAEGISPRLQLGRDRLFTAAAVNGTASPQAWASPKINTYSPLVRTSGIASPFGTGNSAFGGLGGTAMAAGGAGWSNSGISGFANVTSTSALANNVSDNVTDSVVTPNDYFHSPAQRPSRLASMPGTPDVGNNGRDTNIPLNILLDKAKGKVAGLAEGGLEDTSIMSPQVRQELDNGPGYFFPGFTQPLPSLIPPALLRWLYKDPQNNIQGPFTGIDMHQWYRAGYFPLNLPIKRVEEEEFYSMALFIRQVNNQFEPFLVPLPPVQPQSTGWNAEGTDLPASSFKLNAPPKVAAQASVPVPETGTSIAAAAAPSYASVSKHAVGVEPSHPANVKMVEEEHLSSATEPVQAKQSSDASAPFSTSADKEEVVPKTENAKSGNQKETATTVENLAEKLADVAIKSQNVTAASPVKQFVNNIQAKEKPATKLVTNAQPQEKPTSKTNSPSLARTTPWKPLRAKPVPSLDKNISNALASSSPKAEPAKPAQSRLGSPWAKVAEPPISLSEEIQKMEQEDAEMKKQNQAAALASAVAAARTPTLPAASVWGSVNGTGAKKPPAVKTSPVKKNVTVLQKEAHPKTTATNVATNNHSVPNAWAKMASKPVTSSVPVPKPATVATNSASTAVAEGSPDDSWTVVGPGGKLVNNSPAPSTASVVSGSVKPSNVVPSAMASVLPPKLAQLATSSGHSVEFIVWCKNALKGLNNGVKINEFLQMLLSFPAENNQETSEIISDSIYANSTTMDGRRFAVEFTTRRIADLNGKPPTDSKLQESSANSWSQVVKSKPKQQQASEWNSAFKVVTSKKKNKRN
ncbi:GYF domain-containing protein [Schizosaccharomyces japonicus yFS275]|uniref:GYF domain-containing protein n=1 Tax=Schizosaccharomyces japonicus (strain yFS275 / FY16936) TaxID=402676 RepID=B6K087_SCHJY|nr:GYF domain-containing protein [Schizosaccharomyces japonicus yFS275]EEB06237.1 GYF domain-containing protein [Schizosaccharomyces japonicus yFS275]